jgi:hypothetical protein
MARKSDAKRCKWIANADGTHTLKMSWAGQEGEITRQFADYRACMKMQDLFTYFGIESVKAGKPVQADIDLMASRKAARQAAR